VSVSQLPSGNWRAQTYFEGKVYSSAKVLGIDPESLTTERKAKDADSAARNLLRGRRKNRVTVAAWAETWTTDPLYERFKESTNKHNAERVKRFVAKHGSMALEDIDDEIVAQWLAGGKNLSTVPSLKAMFNDAASAKAGRLIAVNPWAGLRLKRSKGRAEQDPPTEAQVDEMLAHAKEITLPTYAAWLEFACFTGMRPGEIDGLRYENVDLNRNRIMVMEQWNAKVRKVTLPKNNHTREILLPSRAKQALMRLPRESEFCFTTARGSHYTPSSRSYHWDRIRTKMDWLDVESRKALYLCTRHFCGWYLWNILELPAEDVAIQLGHEDGGEQVRRTYGHRDRDKALRRIDDAFNRTGEVRHLRVAEDIG
jgi:integrase